MSIQAGDAFAIKVNSHRHQWSGQICSNPLQWNCGASDDFRATQCENGKERCFHLGIFSHGAPRVVIPDRSVEQLLGNNPALLDDQLLFFTGAKFDARGGRNANSADQVLYGAYRIKRAMIDTNGPNQNVIIEPYPDGWVVFPRNLVRKPSTPPAFDSVSYLNRLSRTAVERAVNDAVTEAQGLHGTEALSPSLMERLVHFNNSLEEWMDVAQDAFNAQQPVQLKHHFAGAFTNSEPIDSSLASRLKDALAAKPMKFVKSPVVPQREEQPNDDAQFPSEVELATAVVQADPVPVQELAELVAEPVVQNDTAASIGEDAATEKLDWRRAALPEAQQCTLIAAEYGEQTLRGLRVATITKSLLLLTGAPGVGKSWLATRLLDDPQRERSVIVSVSSTWRGSEDLLGYTNPIDGEFEATEFTRFLRRAELAWKGGDRRPHVAVFEEFNLSQPEHWLSDLLVRLEYEPDRIGDRTIYLGGAKVRGEAADIAPQVYLPPSLVLVGTLNNDHTVRALSPRVLDRATLIEVTATGRTALSRVGMIGSHPVIEEVVEDLNEVLALRGVAFSVRSARSLRRAIDELGEDNAMSILDHVILQEVLSKLRLVSGDPQDEQLTNHLKEWSNREGCAELVLCRERVDTWLQALQSGRDVFQA
jgi:hypothetical protein